MRQKEFISLELERHSLSALLKFPELFYDTEQFFNGKEFTNKINEVIFSVVKSSYQSNEKLDKILLAQKIKNLGINFQEEINIFDYCDILYSCAINKGGGENAIKDLFWLRVKHELYECLREQAIFLKKCGNKSLVEVINEVDYIHNKQISAFKLNEDRVENIFETIEPTIEEIGNNPPDESQFMMGPFSTVNYIMGSLSKPENITVIGARSGVGKTNISMFVNIYLAEKYNLPILWMDQAEMSIKELQFRAVCMFSNGVIPYYAVESGDWRKNPEWERLIRTNIFPRVKKIKFYYQNVGLFSPLETISFIRRFSKRVTGRDKMFLCCYDYLKAFDIDDYRSEEWRTMGKFMKDIKTFIRGEVRIPFWTSVQLNRKGIVTNRKSEQIEDSEDTFSLSDRITHQATHPLLLRQKTNDELAYEKNRYGNMKLQWPKHRHLGRGFREAFKTVKVGKRFLKNYINLDCQSFCFEDKGPATKMVEELSDIYEEEKEEKAEVMM